MEVQEKVGGRYRLLDELGSGGMAVVWRARDEVLSRPVAVKLLAGRYADDPQWRARIRDEARAAAQLSPHAHIAQVYDFGEAGTDLPYVVMELVNGPTLQECAADGPLPPPTVFRICAEVASALEAAHAEGLVHRDIKPANVIVTPAGAKVVDFGIAAAAGPGDPEDIVLGTPAYLAPERLTGGAVQPATDVYALGVLLYRLLANESPWTVESTTQMLNAHVYIEPAPLPPLPGVPAAVTDLVDRCLRKDPADRPPAAEAAAVLAAAAEMEVRAEPAPSVPEQRRADPREQLAAVQTRHGGKRGAIIAVVAVLAAAGLLWILLPTSKPVRRPSQAPPVVTSQKPPTTAGPTTAAGPAPAGGTAPGAAPIPGATVQTTVPTADPGTGQATDPTATAEPTPSRTAASSAPAPRTRTLSSSAGTVEATCSGGKAHLTSWTAKDPYQVESANPGPALTTGVVFGHGVSRIRMTVTCVAGTPTAVVLPL
ncbi:MAG TPA: protein kinase [Actinoplanes sp.]